MFGSAIDISKEKIFCIRGSIQRIIPERLANPIFIFKSICASKSLKAVIHKHVTVIYGVTIKIPFFFQTVLLTDHIYYLLWKCIFVMSKALLNIDCNRIVDGKICFCCAGNPLFFIHTLCHDDNRVEQNDTQKHRNNNEYTTASVTS